MEMKEENGVLRDAAEENMKEPVPVPEEELRKTVGGAGVTPPSGTAQLILERAEQELGKPYEWGAVGPSAYDCSGLVSYCVTGMHTRIGTTSTFMGWPRVSDPQPGDICTSSSHCGIYIGGGSMIHAPTFGTVVSRGPVQSGMIFVRPPET